MYPASYMAFIALELALARTSCADSAAETRHTLASARQKRKRIFKLCQLHLQFTLARPCPCGKNIEYEHGSVNNSCIGFCLYIVDLRRCKLAVGYYKVYIVISTKGGNLRHSSAADICCRRRSFKLLYHRSDYLGSCGFREKSQFLHRDFSVVFARVHTYQKCSFGTLTVFIKLHNSPLQFVLI